ncbi:MAG TPA: hypothetical protein VE991_10205, partial [Acidimicrobiales bacterium]|nr:hypothetical protein [Acidimicrobiales bacterium]
EDVLSHLVESPSTALAVLGTSQRAGRPGGRRLSGTAVAMARRADRPVMLVPASATDWQGPRRVLTPLDGTGVTAMAAASALAAIRGAETVGIPFHLGGDEGAMRRFWQGPVDEHDAWVREARARTLPTATRVETRPGPVGQQVLQELRQTACDLVVLVWSRQTRGAHGAAVLEVLTATPVPVLLVPVSGSA